MHGAYYQEAMHGHEEYKNGNALSVKKANKAVRAGQCLRPLQRGIVPTMDIREHSRLFQARYKGCTNARFILSRSYAHEEFKNGKPLSVQRAHKLYRPANVSVPCSAV